MIVIDVGLEGVTVAQLTHLRGARTHLWHRSVGLRSLPDGFSEADWLAAVTTAFEVLRDRKAVHGEAVMCLPDRFAFAKVLRVPAVAAQRREVIEFEVNQSFPLPPAEIVWDCSVGAAIDGTCDVVVTAAKLSVVEALVALTEAAGWSLVQVVPASHALIAGVRAKSGDRVQTAVLLDLTSDPGRVFWFGPGGHLVKLHSLRGALADPGAADHEKALQELVRLLAQCARELRGPPLEIVHCLGVPEGSVEFARQIRERFKVAVELLIVETRAAAEPETCLKVEPTGTLQLATMLGLMSCPDRAINLLPEARRAAVAARRRRPWLIAAGVLAVIGLLAPLLYFQAASRRLHRAATEMRQTIEPLRTAAAALDAKRKVLGSARRELGELQEMLTAKTHWRDFLADLQMRLGEVEDVWLDSLAPVPGRSETAGPGAEPLGFAVRGRMLDAAHPTATLSAEASARVKRLLSRIAESPFVAQVGGERFDNAVPGVLRFDATLTLVPVEELKWAQ